MGLLHTIRDARTYERGYYAGHDDGFGAGFDEGWEAGEAEAI